MYGKTLGGEAFFVHVLKCVQRKDSELKIDSHLRRYREIGRGGGGGGGGGAPRQSDE